ncbi:hypothetical protein CDL15_Pgr010755 [Punica granatum]|uniref:PARP catalytic domain-containing protein n=1 Tax=Punica granatum TaxID=22663 RepID=A0A218W4N4_PUNGR|nr:hypothetical protein CDL15_Pgr010755 [Punica granatum]
MCINLDLIIIFWVLSAGECDVHDDGVRYMLFCRIILGKVDVIFPGSTQSRPWSDEYGTGLDNPILPNRYVIWDEKKITHIFPEHVIAFRMQGK